MTRETKRILGWIAVAVIIIGSFLAIIFASQGDDTTTTPDGEVVLAPVKDGEWIKGSSQSKVELVEYSDFQCPACKAREAQIKQILGEFGEHVKFVYRHFPLRLNHPNGQIAAQASEAAGLQGKFWEMHGKLFENQEEWSGQNNTEVKASFVSYAKELGLDVAKFEEDLTSNVAEDAVDEDYSSGLAAGVNSTPSFFLNGKKISPQSYEEFRSLIRTAIDKNRPAL